MGDSFEGQAGTIARAFLAFRKAPYRQTLATSSEELAVRTESNPGGPTSQCVIGWDERLQRCQVPYLDGLRCRLELSRGQEAAIWAEGYRLDRVFERWESAQQPPAGGVPEFHRAVL